MVALGGQKRRVRLGAGDDGLAVELPDEGRTLRADAPSTGGRASALFRGALDGRAFTAEVAPAAEGFRHPPPRRRGAGAGADAGVGRPARAPAAEKIADTSRLVLSPMPGLVVSIEVEAGQDVKAGETSCIVEAMKMQNIIRAERDGVVKHGERQGRRQRRRRRGAGGVRLIGGVALTRA